MKVLVTHVYSEQNAGDAALLSVLLDQIIDTAPDAEIVIHSIDEVSGGATFDSFAVRPALMGLVLRQPIGRVRKLAAAVGVICLTISSAVTKGRIPVPTRYRAAFHDYEWADVVIGVGGGYLRGKRNLTSSVELLLMLHPMWLSRALGRPVVMHSMSVGPFGYRVQETMTIRTLRYVDLLLVREGITEGRLRRRGMNANLVRTVDAGFAFQGTRAFDLRDALGANGRTLLVGVTVRRWLDARGQGRYEQAMARLCDHMVDAHSAVVVFVPQVTAEAHGDDDREISRRVAGIMKNDAAVLGDRYDHRTIKGIYEQLDLVVGTRFHSVIFSLTSGVPALAIEYEHKTSGIMRDLGLAEWVLGMEEADDAALITMFDRLIAQRARYQEHLAEAMPPYARHIDACAQELADVLTKVRSR